MEYKKFTDEEIIKALKCCNEIENRDCLQCPYFSVPYSFANCSKRAKDTIDLINHQRAEIDCLRKELEKLHSHKDFLRAEVERLQTEKDNLIKTYGECMIEVVKEFAERLKEKAEYYSDLLFKTVDVEDIDNLVKEMTE